MTYTALDLLRDLRLLAEGLEQISLGLAQAADQLHTIHQGCDRLYASLNPSRLGVGDCEMLDLLNSPDYWRGLDDGEAEREEEKGEKL